MVIAGVVGKAGFFTIPDVAVALGFPPEPAVEEFVAIVDAVTTEA